MSQTNIGWLTVKFGIHFHGPQRPNCNNFDLLTFHLTTSGQNLILSNTSVYDQISAKHMTIPLATAALYVQRKLVNTCMLNQQNEHG